MFLSQNQKREPVSSLFDRWLFFAPRQRQRSITCGLLLRDIDGKNSCRRCFQVFDLSFGLVSSNALATTADSAGPHRIKTREGRIGTGLKRSVGKVIQIGIVGMIRIVCGREVINEMIELVAQVVQLVPNLLEELLKCLLRNTDGGLLAHVLIEDQPFKKACCQSHRKPKHFQAFVLRNDSITMLQWHYYNMRFPTVMCEPLNL